MSNSNGHLRGLVERIERLEAEKSAIAQDIKEIYIEAKSAGFDVKAMRALIRERKQDANKAAELAATVELYRAALGDLAATPLGQAMEPRT